MYVIMKKLIQICSLLSLVFIFTAVSASAQAEYGGEVEFPFAFSVGDRAYGAGKYTVKLARLDSGAAAIIIVDRKTNSVQTVLVQRNGFEPHDDLSFVFDKINGERFLSQVVTPGGGYALLNRPSRKAAVAKRSADAQVVSVSDLF